MLATPAQAHLVQTGFGTFYDGIAHLFLTPADLLFVLALGLLAGLRGAALARPLLVVLPGSWLVGGIVGALHSGASEFALGLALSVALCGALVAADLRLARAWFLVFAAGAGAMHGYVGGATMERFDLLHLFGAALAGFVLVTLVAGLVVGLKARWQELAVRVAGSWIAAIGLLMLGWRARGG
jgi:hydrogenase/urease accessory protein HupE